MAHWQFAMKNKKKLLIFYGNYCNNHIGQESVTLFLWPAVSLRLAALLDVLHGSDQLLALLWTTLTWVSCSHLIKWCPTFGSPALLSVCPLSQPGCNVHWGLKSDSCTSILSSSQVFVYLIYVSRNRVWMTFWQIKSHLK